MKKCPKCGSKDVKVIDEEMGFIKCNNCNFDELEDDLSSSEERSTQREKTRYNPYKAGGKGRGRKK